MPLTKLHRGKEIPMTPEEEVEHLESQKYASTLTEARQKKDAEVKQAGTNLYKEYRDSDMTISQTAIDAYKASLIADYNAAKANVLAIDTGSEDGDIAAIGAYQVNWNPPA